MNGEWDNEPNSKDWTAHGLPCALRRGPGGHWCGYVGVTEGHPLYGIGYHDESSALTAALERRRDQPLGDNPSMATMLSLLSGELSSSPDVAIDVHGGLTFSEHGDKAGRLPHGYYWFGFDCGHCDDFCPKHSWSRGGTYRNIAYAINETERLAEQLAFLAIESQVGGR